MALMSCLNAVAAADDMDSSVVGAEDGTLAVENDDVSDTLSAGNSWYVKADATGGDGSESNPYNNLKTAFTNAGEGDTIFVMDGTYQGTSNTKLTLNKNNLIIKNYENSNPIFDAENKRQIFDITGNNILITGLTFINGYFQYGACIDIEGNNVSVKNCNFDTGKAQYGGLVYIDPNYKDVVVDHCNFKNGVATTMGGAIFSNNLGAVVSNCNFNDNYAVYGAGIVTQSQMEIINSTFENGNSTYAGAVLLYGNNARNVVFDNDKFRRNVAEMGGAIMFYAPTNNDNTILNCEFTSNKAINPSSKTSGNYFGGALYIASSGNKIVDSTFNTNYADANGEDESFNCYGGAIYSTSKGSNTTIDGCTFLGNYAQDLGGAFYTISDNNTVLNSNFNFNNALIDGGAICAVKNNNLIENSTFYRNVGARGAVYLGSNGIDTVNQVVKNCTFRENGIDNSKGGAIFSCSNNTNVTDSKFIDNRALLGGSIVFADGYNFLENNIFTGNKAVRYGGGAISSAGKNDKVSNCKFENNIAQGYGGAISMNYVTVEDSLFTDNHANLGGAIYTINATVSGCEFNNNEALNKWVVVGEDKLQLSNNKNLEELVIIDDLLAAGIEQIPVQFGHDKVLNVVYDVDTEENHVEGYSAFCVEQISDAPTFGVVREDLIGVKNSLTEENVGEYLKLLVYYYYNDNTNYKEFQTLVNIFTDTNYAESDDETVKDVIAKYNAGERIPNVLSIKNSDESVTQYLFKSLIVPQATQNLFLFNISTSKPNMTVEKISLTPEVTVGMPAYFLIRVNNTGECVLTNINVTEMNSEGLSYQNFSDSTGKWIFIGSMEHPKWQYNGILNPNESAEIMVIYNTLRAGTFTNVVAVDNNQTTGNGKNDTVIHEPNLKVEKITLTTMVPVGEMTSFLIRVTNIGDCDLDGVYVKELKFDGLVYDHFTSVSGKWIFDGKDKWTYNDILAEGEKSQFTVFFKTVKAGNFTNIVVAGSDLTNETPAENITETFENKTSVNDTNNSDNQDELDDLDTIDEIEDINETSDVTKEAETDVNFKRATGNPLFALLAVLLLVGVSRIRKFK